MVFLNQSSVSVYVDNLPYEMDSVWLRQLFRPFGDVTDVYIPKKKSSSFNTKFGFVRYKSREEADRAIQELDGMRIRDFPIQVNLARYPQSSKNVVLSQNSGVPFAGIMNRPSYAFKDNSKLKSVFVEDRPLSFADIVSGKKSSASCLSIKVREDDIQWLSMSAIAKLPSQRSVESLREAFISEGVWNVHIRQMGGNFVLLTFESTDHMKSMLEGGGLCWLLNFFDEVKQWAPEPVTEYYRVVWLNCYGIPLNVWNADTFFSIGRLWGEVITLDEATSTRSSLSVGKVKITTKAFEVINHIVNLEYNGKVFPVRVVEEQVGVNSFIKAICECNGANLVNHVSPSESGVKPGTKEGVDGGDDDDDSVRNVEEYKEASQAKGNSVKEVGGTEFPTFSEKIVVSACDETPSCIGIQDVEMDPLLSRPPLLASDDSISVAKETSTISGSDNSQSADLVSTDPLINFVEYKRRKKKARAKKGFQRNPLWTKNPLKAAIFSKTVNRDQKEDKLKSLKKGNFDGPISSSIVDSSSDIRKRYAILIKEARESMEISSSLGVKFFGRESYNIKKFLEMQGVEISEQDIIAFDEVEDSTSISVEF